MAKLTKAGGQARTGTLATPAAGRLAGGHAQGLEGPLVMAGRFWSNGLLQVSPARLPVCAPPVEAAMELATDIAKEKAVHGIPGIPWPLLVEQATDQ